MKNKKVMLVVDAQRNVVKDAWNRDSVVKNIALAVEKARKAGVPVLWVQHENEELVKNSDGWKLAEPLESREGDLFLGKKYNSSFEDTELEEILRDRGIAEIVLGGAATNWCIRATAYGALERGFNLTLISDGHTTEDTELQDGRIIKASDIIADLNICMKWVEYAGAKNTSVTAGDLEF